LPADNDGNLEELFNAFSILTARITAIAQRVRYEQLTSSILGSITDPLLVLNEHKYVTLLNPAAEKLFAITTSEALGAPLSNIIRSDELLALTNGKNKDQTEWVSENGKTFIPRAEPILDSQSNIEGWVIALRDISRFKKLNRNQYEFTRNVTHDLRSPLTSMHGFASMLELGAVGDLNEKQVHFIEKILSGINQISVLVDNIQDAGRYDPETGFYEMSRSQCDLNDLINRIVENHLVPAEKQELKLSVDVGDHVPIINADVVMLERALRNLVDNAIKYTPNGGSIKLGVEKQGEQIIITVADSGLGIGQENQQKLFERGVRIHREEHKRVKGSGLGLFIVRSAAQRHGGDAWVKSDDGQGSTFFMSIPLEGPNLLGSRQET
jgi:two-component system phosphate regulon sensor histidine kinase PhoR